MAEYQAKLATAEKVGGSYTTLPKAVFLLSAALLVMRSAETFYAPILPLYVRILDASVPLFIVGLVTSIHRLGTVITSPVAGSWCDRVGRRKPFIIGVMAASIASILGGFAFSLTDLTVYRTLSGMGYGILTIAAFAYINSIVTAQNRATAMSLVSASTLAGAALGPFPGGYIAESFTPALLGYRMTFYAGGLLQLLVGIYAFFLIHDGVRNNAAIPQADKKPGGGGVLRSRAVTMTSLNAFLFGISLGAYLYFTVPLLGESLGFGPVRIGWIISAFGAGHVLGSLFIGPLSDRAGKRKPFVFIAVFGMGLLVMLFSTLQSLPLMVITTFIIGVITAPCCGIVPALVAESVPGMAATAMAFQKSAEQLGIFAGPIIGGVLISTLGYSTALIIYGAIAVGGSLIFVFTVSERKLPL